MITIQSKKTLAERVLSFQTTGDGYDELVSELSWKAYNFPKKKQGMNEDDCAEFFLFVCSAIKRLPKTYRAGNVPFDAYFNTLLRLKFKTYLDRKMNKPGAYESANTKEFDETAPGSAADLAPAYGPNPEPVEDVPAIEPCTEESERKQMLFLALKYALHLDPVHIEKLHRLTGFPEEHIFRAVNDAKERTEKKVARLASFTERRDRIYHSIGVLRSKLASARCHDVSRAAAYEAKLSVLEQRHRKLLDTISKISTTVSNREIAEITGYPKGTIDTSLRRLKTRLETIGITNTADAARSTGDTTPRDDRDDRCA